MNGTASRAAPSTIDSIDMKSVELLKTRLLTCWPVIQLDIPRTMRLRLRNSLFCAIGHKEAEAIRRSIFSPTEVPSKRVANQALVRPASPTLTASGELRKISFSIASPRIASFSIEVRALYGISLLRRSSTRLLASSTSKSIPSFLFSSWNRLAVLSATFCNRLITASSP